MSFRENLKHKVDILIRDFRVGISNLIVWFPVIWLDRQWDQVFFYKILRKKLSLMEKQFRTNGLAITSEDEAKKMKLCVLLLERLLADNYEENAEREFRKRWGEPRMVTTPVPNNERYSELHIVYDSVKTPEHEKQRQREFLNYMQHADNMKKQDLELLFKTIEKNIQGWWD